MRGIPGAVTDDDVALVRAEAATRHATNATDAPAWDALAAKLHHIQAWQARITEAVARILGYYDHIDERFVLPDELRAVREMQRDVQRDVQPDIQPGEE